MQNKTNTTLTTKQIVSEVDNFIQSMGLTDEILGLKTKQDKLLYYSNYLDSSNIFKGIIDFHNLYHIQLANLICKSDDMQEQFAEFWKDRNKDDSNSVNLWHFRCKLLDDRTEQEEQGLLNQIKECINDNDWISFKETIQELFLDIVNNDVVNRFIGMIEQGLTADDIFQWYKRNHGRAASITTFNLGFVKERVA